MLCNWQAFEISRPVHVPREQHHSICLRAGHLAFVPSSWNHWQAKIQIAPSFLSWWIDHKKRFPRHRPSGLVSTWSRGPTPSNTHFVGLTISFGAWGTKYFLHLPRMSLNSCIAPTLRWSWVKSYLVEGTNKYYLGSNISPPSYAHNEGIHYYWQVVDLFNKIKRNFFLAVAMLVLQYGCPIWTLT